MFVYGHRGAAGEAPENTLAAVRAGLAAGCPGIEIDVRAVEDQALVIHDATFERTTSGHGPVEGSRLAEVRSYRTADGAALPLLPELVAAVAGRALLNVELKDAVVVPATVAALAGVAEVLASSFLPTALRALRERAPDLRLAYNCERGEPEEIIEHACALGCEALHVPVIAVDPVLVRAVHAAGLRLAAFTCNDLDEARHLRDWGCDAIFTDRPSLLVPALR